ncbi:MAG: hypothetical protein WB792_10140 [Desulfobacterales bacterium]
MFALACRLLAQSSYKAGVTCLWHWMQATASGGILRSTLNSLTFDMFWAADAAAARCGTVEKPATASHSMAISTARFISPPLDQIVIFIQAPGAGAYFPSPR